MRLTISYRLSGLQKKDMVKVVYYNDGEYLEIQGLVSKMDPVNQEFTFVKNKINFNDIYDLRVIEKSDKI